jgi:hypothetical protein
MRIGIICEERQKPAASEFFELFKVPWEFCVNERVYDVVITAGHTDVIPPARLLIVFGPERKSCDTGQVSHMNSDKRGVLVEYKGQGFPVYLETALFESSLNPVIKGLEFDGLVGVQYQLSEQRLIRIGYDLFDEVENLLSQGQPIKHAEIPTLDMHIRMLREWIVDAEIILVEIPPQPGGFDFAVCLTHDVDFINIRDHMLDRSLMGFLTRALFPKHLRNTRSRIVWSRLLKNWLAVLSLPAVYLGFCKDTWFDMDRYMELESGLGSTYFFIALKNHPGRPMDRETPPWRAARYDVKECKPLVTKLKQGGSEIGLHGLDAWQNLQDGLKEREIITKTSDVECEGIRMHWLYFSKESPRFLEEAGFSYDSTMGYNDAIGFRSGTTQAFCLPGTSNVFELQLNVMDTALFYPDRMGLSEANALELCKGLIRTMKAHGGVLTVNWHTRSLRPERNWDSFYMELLDILKIGRVWFATANEAVNWFKRRRQIQFESVEHNDDRVRIKLGTGGQKNLTGFLLRLHGVKEAKKSGESDQCLKDKWIDIALADRTEIEIVA